jgi:hypothetical protein
MDYKFNFWHSVYSFEKTKNDSASIYSCGGYYHKLPVHRQYTLKGVTFESIGLVQEQMYINISICSGSGDTANNRESQDEPSHSFISANRQYKQS